MNNIKLLKELLLATIFSIVAFWPYAIASSHDHLKSEHTDRISSMIAALTLWLNNSFFNKMILVASVIISLSIFLSKLTWGVTLTIIFGLIIIYNAEYLVEKISYVGFINSIFN
jgi:type IV secretory pathway VirB2 component (pilin)